jgi:hypothetical protein
MDNSLPVPAYGDEVEARGLKYVLNERGDRGRERC